MDFSGGFKVFKVFCTKTEHESTTQKHMKNIPPYVTEDKSPVSEGEEHHVKNDDELDESQPRRLYILCWKERSPRRLLPAVSPAAGHLTTPTVAGLPGAVKISTQRPPRVAQFNAR